MKAVLKNVQRENNSQNVAIFITEDSLLDDIIEIILRQEYERLCKQTNDVVLAFKTYYPSVKDLHNLVIGNDKSLLEIHCDLSMVGNIEIRKMIECYLNRSVCRMSYNKCSNNAIYGRYKERLSEIRSKNGIFSYKEKSQCFMIPSVCEFLQSVYIRMCKELLSTRARNFVKIIAPNFKDLVPYMDVSFHEYKKLCPRQNMEKTLAEIYSLNGCLKVQFDKYWQMEDAEVRVELFRQKYPFLSSSERRFVMEHECVYGMEPLFFLLYNYMRISDERNNKIFSLLYGIFDGKERTLDELSAGIGLSRERIRQIVSEKLEVHATDLIKSDAWKKYESLLYLPFVTKETSEYLLLKEREHLNFDFRVFARLMQLVGERNIEITINGIENTKMELKYSNQYEVETIDNLVVLINRKKMPSIKIKECVANLRKQISLRYANDTFIFIESQLGTVDKNEKIDAVKLLAYIAKKGFGLNVNENNEVLMHKNCSFNVAEELYKIISQNGKPMSLADIFVEFIKTYPEQKDIKVSDIRFYLFDHPKIKPIGKTSCYGIDNWENVFYGSIRDLLIKQLEASNEPLQIQTLFDIVVKHFPNTNMKSLKCSMTGDELNRFVKFDNGFFGLNGKKYDLSYEICSEKIQRCNFDEHFREFREFVKNYNRYPTSNNGENEYTLYRWLRRVTNGECKITNEQQIRFNDSLKRDEVNLIPRNAVESEFRDNCRGYKEYINNHYALPNVSSEPELYNWMVRSKQNYNSFLDHRRTYLTDLFNYILSLGFKI